MAIALQEKEGRECILPAGGVPMELDARQRDAVASVIERLDARLGRMWDMIGVGLWSCRPPVYLRLEFQYIRNGGHRVVYLASGVAYPTPGEGVELLLTRRVQRPEDYTGPYSGGSADINLRGIGCGVGVATTFPPGSGGPLGVSAGLSSPGANLWVAEYRIIGHW